MRIAEINDSPMDYSVVMNLSRDERMRAIKKLNEEIMAEKSGYHEDNYTNRHLQQETDVIVTA